MTESEALDTLRPVRLYHWRAFCRAQKHATACRKEKKHGAAMKFEERERIHGAHVQALNAFFPAGDTADNDLQRERAQGEMA